MTGDSPSKKVCLLKDRMRKGTHACLECRRRKLKCDRVKGQATPCVHCKIRERLCVPQDPSENLIERITPPSSGLLSPHCMHTFEEADDLGLLLLEVEFTDSVFKECLELLVSALNQQQGREGHGTPDYKEQYRLGRELLNVLPKSRESVVLNLLALGYLLRQASVEDAWSLLQTCTATAISLELYEIGDLVNHRIWLILIYFDRMISTLARRPHAIREDLCSWQYLEIQAIMATLGPFMGMRWRFALLIGQAADLLRKNQKSTTVQADLETLKIAIEDTSSLDEIGYMRLMLDYYMAKTCLQPNDRNAVISNVIEVAPLYETLWLNHPSSFVNYADITLCGSMALLTAVNHLVTAQQDYQATEKLREELALENEIVFNKGPIRLVLMRFQKLFRRVCVLNEIAFRLTDHVEAVRDISALIKLKRRCPELENVLEHRMTDVLRRNSINMNFAVFGVDLSQIIKLLHTPLNSLSFPNDEWKDSMSELWSL